MAELMCKGCGQTLPAGTPYCPVCFSIPVPKTAEPTVPVVKASGGGPCADPDCATGGTPPAAGCRACGLKGAGATGLRFPWGPVPVRAGVPLVIGREGSPIADRLDGYSNVSRQHAKVSSDGTTLTVVDLASTNGTYVNDEKIPPHAERPLRPGDRVRFAARLEATVDGGTA